MSSSALGSPRCLNIRVCYGSVGDYGSADPCHPHDVWSGTYSGNMRTFFNLAGGSWIRAIDSATVRYAFSARCVRYLIKCVFSVRF